MHRQSNQRTRKLVFIHNEHPVHSQRTPCSFTTNTLFINNEHPVHSQQTLCSFTTNTLVGRIGNWLFPRLLKVARLQDRIPAVAEPHRFILCMHEAQGVLSMRVGGATSQLDLPSLAPLSVAGCGRLQLGVPHCCTSVDYCKCW